MQSLDGFEISDGVVVPEFLILDIVFITTSPVVNVVITWYADGTI